MTTTIEYSLERVSLADVREATDAIWRGMASEPKLQAELARLGVPIDFCAKASRAETLELRAESHHADPVTVALVVAFAPVAARIAQEIWTALILPRLQVKFGEKAIRKRIKK